MHVRRTECTNDAIFAFAAKLPSPPLGSKAITWPAPAVHLVFRWPSFGQRCGDQAFRDRFPKRSPQEVIVGKFPNVTYEAGAVCVLIGVLVVGIRNWC